MKTELFLFCLGTMLSSKTLAQSSSWPPPYAYSPYGETSPADIERPMPAQPGSPRVSRIKHGVEKDGWTISNAKSCQKKGLEYYKYSKETPDGHCELDSIYTFDDNLMAVITRCYTPGNITKTQAITRISDTKFRVSATSFITNRQMMTAPDNVVIAPPPPCRIVEESQLYKIGSFIY